MKSDKVPFWVSLAIILNPVLSITVTAVRNGEPPVTAAVAFIIVASAIGLLLWLFVRWCGRPRKEAADVHTT